MNRSVAPSPSVKAPRKPPWRRLHVRIAVAFLALLALVQFVGGFILQGTIEGSADTQVAGNLRTSEIVLQRLLTLTGQKRAEQALLWSADTGFRAAALGADKTALTAALERQAAAQGAAFAAYTDKERNLVASTQGDATRFHRLVRSSLDLRVDAPDIQLGVMDGLPYQLISVPVRSPQLVGHVSMGFALKSDFIQDISSQSAAQVALMGRARGQSGWQALALGEVGVQLADRTFEVVQNSLEVTIGRELFRGRLVPLSLDEDREVAALLLSSVDAAVAPYRELQRRLLLIGLLGALATGWGSLILARRVTVPLQKLIDSAQRLGEGDFSQPVPEAGGDEVGDLARSFETMRQAMQAREEQILRLAYWDALTGLPNRAQFGEKSAALVQRALARQEPCTLLMLDLDRFKLINDVMGHSFGDRVLKRLSQRLVEGVLRQGDLFARLSGDSFAMCLPGLSEAQAIELGHRVLTTLERPLQLDDQTIDITGSIGVAVCPMHGQEAGLLLSRAEVAMYAAKASRLGVRTFDEGLDSSSASSLSLLTELRTAVDTNQLQVYLQPKVRLSDGEVVGAEALVRWEHPERGLVQPMQFVPFAEQSGFVRVLTAWMIEHTARYAGSIASSLPGMKFGVNLSARDLLDQDFADKVRDLVGRGGMNFSRLTLEITESSIMEDPERSLQTLLKLRALGLRLSIDDFGTGYSSLAYLKRLPLDELKIDRSFVMSMQSDPADAKIVRSTIDLAHNLGLSVVAEGIDSPEAFSLLRELGCDEGQGYRLARPMPAAYFAEWARRWQNDALQASPGALSER